MTPPRTGRARRRAAPALALLLAFLGSAAAAAGRYAGGPVVADLVARLLEQTHYQRRPVDDDASRRFLRNYLDAFDYNHMILNKADVEEFEARFGTALDDRIKAGDVEPAYEIFDRVLKRLEDRVALVKKLTAKEEDFSKEESAALDRHEAPWPAEGPEMEEIWRLRVKHDMLLERLSRRRAEEAKARAEAARKRRPEVAASTAAARAPDKPAKETSIKEVVDTRSERLLRSYREYEGVDVIQAYLNALCAVFDPHTDYLAAAQKENFDISMRLSLVGIGALLRSEDGYARIVSLVPGGPAETDKRLKPDDKIEAVAQGDAPFVEVVGLKIDHVVSLIRGEKGTVVRLRIIPADALDPSVRATVALVRDEIKLTDQEAKARLFSLPAAAGRTRRVGVVDLPSFYADLRGGPDGKSASRDVERLLGELRRRGAEALIVDLRRDSGGSLPEAISLTGLFIPEGPVVQVKDHRGLVKVMRDGDPATAWDGPLVVLTSRGSASAAEIFAAAIQDYRRGVVAGEKSTFGKGTVQSVLELNQYLPPAYRAYKPGALKLTVQKFYRISGGSTQNRGVEPDIHIPSIGDAAYTTESKLPNALPYDETAPAEGAALGEPLPVARLAQDSAARLADSREFRWIAEDIERYEREKKDKTASLSEATRWAESRADEERAAARRKERARRPEKAPESEEITLAMLDGKAPAVAKSTAAPAAPAPPEDEEDAGYERAPEAPDAVLLETLRIAADLAAAGPAPSEAAARRAGR